MTVSHSSKGFQSREKNPNWKGGRTITEHGYVLVRVGKGHPLADVRGYAYEHRLKAWEAGQNIDGKDVHHEDENRQRNAIENLEALTRAEHRFRHRLPGSRLRLPNEENTTIYCDCSCGSSFLKFDEHGRPRRFIPGHNTEIKNPLIECACGCGETLKQFNARGNERKYIFGHKPKRENPMVFCACGCRSSFRKFDSGNRSRRFVSGHNTGGFHA